ncbi:MAG: hypothetical protein AB7E51_06630 [Pseudodesulfovibrio sp.]|uniref:hypothetical protein n=1 Tax=Pseudodesulfovibrio sp. TaxID=2035812 RepID=UPI003D144E7C
MEVWERDFELYRVTAISPLGPAPEEIGVEFDNVTFSVALGDRERRYYSFEDAEQAKRSRAKLIEAVYGQE